MAGPDEGTISALAELWPRNELPEQRDLSGVTKGHSTLSFSFYLCEMGNKPLLAVRNQEHSMGYA